jgi:GMP synthase-like glutamine amidotransferase
LEHILIMKPIWIFRHIECEGPAYFADVLQSYGIPYQLIAVDGGQAIPAAPADAGGLVFMGGPMSVNDSDAWIRQELDLIRRAAERNIPVLGHCLGGQLISKALDAAVYANPVKEIGWHAVDKIPSLEADYWLPQSDWPRELFHWHGETFELPAGVTPLLRSAFCANQAYVRGNILALQCHVEMLPAMVGEWARLYAAEIAEPSLSVQSFSQMSENLEMRIAGAQHVADALYDAWLKRGGFIN